MRVENVKHAKVELMINYMGHYMIIRVKKERGIGFLLYLCNRNHTNTTRSL